ncbi:hypothetical protein XMM354_003320 [Aliiroseovarius sp. xm-m-354]|nr:hypothetical protein [Aliiroseovarius sp. xm-m-354]
MTVLANPLRPARDIERACQPAFDHRIRRTLTPLDRSHQRDGTRRWIGLNQIAKRTTRFGEVLIGDVQFGQQHLGFGMVGL